MTETVIIKGLAALTAAITPEEPEETPATVTEAAAPTRTTKKKITSSKK